MVNLKTAGLRFDSLMYRDDGLPFRGTVEQDLEGKLIGYDFSYPRRLLRVSPECLIKTLDVIVDDLDRRFLVADHDGAFAYNIVEYRSHMLIPLTKKVTWEREVTIVDPLTQLPKSTGQAPMGEIWILPERINREVADSSMRVKEEGFTVFTSANLQLNDLVDGMVVKRLNTVRGVYLAEVQ
ncbi:hypothetical protein ACCS91_33415 [Rhizobium ruizarguesonis]